MYMCWLIQICMTVHSATGRYLSRIVFFAGSKEVLRSLTKTWIEEVPGIVNCQ